MAGNVALVLVLLWILGMATSYTVGGLLHALPAIAAALIAWHWVRSRRGLRAPAAAPAARATRHGGQR